MIFRCYRFSFIDKGTSKKKFSNFEVLAPYYWKYKDLYSYNTKYKVNLGIDFGFYGKMTQEISAFTRKLPVGQVASSIAKDLAKKYCLELEEGETIVSPFTRNSKIRVI